MAVIGRTGMFPHAIDKTTDANTSVDYEHKEVHAGKAFYITRVNELDIGELRSERFQTPNSTTWMHMVWIVEAQANVLIELRETITDAFQPELDLMLNRNRNYADNLTVMVHDYSAAAATNGTVIWSWSAGGAAATPAVAKTPAVVRASGEFVLKQNEKYELRVTSTVDNNTISMYVTWYELRNVE